MTSASPIPSASGFAPQDESARLVYCTYCNKTHAVQAGEEPCAPNCWLEPEPVPDQGATGV